jgi:hypothetical protein
MQKSLSSIQVVHIVTTAVHLKEVKGANVFFIISKTRDLLQSFQLHLERLEISETPCKCADVSKGEQTTPHRQTPGRETPCRRLFVCSLEPLCKTRDTTRTDACQKQTQTPGYLTSLKEQTDATEVFEFQFETVLSVSKLRVTMATYNRQHCA